MSPRPSPVHETRDPPGNLLKLSPVLHGQAEIFRHRRTRRTLPKAFLQIRRSADQERQAGQDRQGSGLLHVRQESEDLELSACQN